MSSIGFLGALALAVLAIALKAEGPVIVGFLLTIAAVLAALGEAERCRDCNATSPDVVFVRRWFRLFSKMRFEWSAPYNVATLTVRNEGHYPIKVEGLAQIKDCTYRSNPIDTRRFWLGWQDAVEREITIKPNGVASLIVAKVERTPQPNADPIDWHTLQFWEFGKADPFTSQIWCRQEDLQYTLAVEIHCVPPVEQEPTKQTISVALRPPTAKLEIADLAPSAPPGPGSQTGTPARAPLPAIIAAIATILAAMIVGYVVFLAHPDAKNGPAAIPPTGMNAATSEAGLWCLPGEKNRQALVNALEGKPSGDGVWIVSEASPDSSRCAHLVKALLEEAHWQVTPMYDAYPAGTIRAGISVTSDWTNEYSPVLTRALQAVDERVLFSPDENQRSSMPTIVVGGSPHAPSARLWGPLFGTSAATSSPIATSRRSPKPRATATPEVSPARTPGPMEALANRALFLSSNLGNLLLLNSAKVLGNELGKSWYERLYPDRTEKVLFSEMRDQYQRELQAETLDLLVAIGKVRPSDASELRDLHRKAAAPERSEDLHDIERYLSDVREKLHD